MESLMKNLLLLEQLLNMTEDNSAESSQFKKLIAAIKEDIFQQDELNESNKFLIQKLREDNAFYLAAIDSLPNPIFVKNENAEFAFFNDAYKKYFNINDNYYIGKTVHALDYLSTQERKQYHEEDISLIQTQSFSHSKKNFHLAEDGEHVAFYWSCGFESPDLKKGLVGEIVDISLEVKLQEELQNTVRALEVANIQIEEAKNLDNLTNVYNRYKLDSFIDTIKEIRKNKSYAVCVLLADLDHFKTINDKFGHVYGDEMLRKFANILVRTCRKNDVIVRYGGEEFLILLPDSDIKSVEVIAERIRRNCEFKLKLPDGNNITVSLGGTIFLDDEDFDTCLIRSDDALYKAKTLGRNRVVIK